jgi:hypothetical protein
LAETVHAVAQVCCPHELETRGRSRGVISTPEIVHGVVQPVVEQGPSGESVSEARELLREIVGTVRARHTDHLIAKFERSKFYL